jgi:hypothetical protein
MKAGNIGVLLRNATIFIVLPIILLMVIRIVEELKHGETFIVGIFPESKLPIKL